MLNANCSIGNDVLRYEPCAVCIDSQAETSGYPTQYVAVRLLILCGLAQRGEPRHCCAPDGLTNMTNMYSQTISDPL